MFTVLILPSASVDSYQPFSPLLSESIEKGEVSICEWIENADTVEEALPTLYPAIEGKKEWQVIVADIVSDVYEEKYKVVWLPVNDLAVEAGSVQSANIVSIGAFIKLTGAFDIEEAEQILCQFFEDKGKGKFNKFNVAALRAGYNAVE